MDYFDDFDELDFNESTNSTIVWEDVSFFEGLDPDNLTDERTGTCDSTTRPRKSTRKKKIPDIRCHRCSNAYVSVGGYAEHLKTHAWDDIKSRVPSVEDFCLWARDAAPVALKEISGSIICAGYGSATVDFLQCINCDSIEWRDFMNFLCDELFRPIHKKIGIMPSQLLESAQSAVLKFLGTAETRVEALWRLSQCHSDDVPKPVLSVVSQKFIFKLMDKVVVQHLQQMKDQSNKPKRKLVNTARTEKIIHYAAGSVVKGVLRKGFRYRHNQWWCVISEVVKKYFLPGDTPISESASEWTDARNRGGLTRVNQHALSFFMSVAQILADKEQSASIASHVELIQAMFSDADIMKKWDILCQGSLPHEDSMHLLILISRGFCNTFSRGVIRRRKNAVKQFASVPLRSRLAR